MRCPACGQENPAGARFCIACGSRLAAVCAQCGAALPEGARYCPACGQAVAATIGYATLRFLGEQHLKDCVRVLQEAQLQLPAPAAPAPAAGKKR